MEPRGEPGVSAQWTHEAAHEGIAHLEHPGTSSDVKTSRSATGRRVRTADVHDYEACDLFDWAKLIVPNAVGFDQGCLPVQPTPQRLCPRAQQLYAATTRCPGLHKLGDRSIACCICAHHPLRYSSFEVIRKLRAAIWSARKICFLMATFHTIRSQVPCCIVNSPQQGFGIVRTQAAPRESPLNCWLDLVHYPASGSAS